MHPIDILIRSIVSGSGGGGGDSYEDTVEAHNEKWLESHGTDVYLKSTEGQSWDSDYFSILDSVSGKEDTKIPYTEDDYAVLYSVDSGVYYFWLPMDGSRLKVYEDNGLTVFESSTVDDFSNESQVTEVEAAENSLEEQLDNLKDDVEILDKVVYGKENYGFHINSSESDPYACVTYIADAVGKTPAHMDYANDTFIWGSWENAFFMPRPCMLRYDGTVDYYLDPNDYSKREDGTASDVANTSYWGNAMMEWGRDGKRIWYKIVPDTDPTSASVYVAPYQVDENYRCWSFINNQGNLVEHFYTPIYNGSIDTEGRLRSISGKTYTDLCKNKTAAQEVTASELNNPSSDKLWYTEVFADITLINILLILMGKSLNTQAVFGNGVQGQGSSESSMISTGTMDTKGLFWGGDDNTHGVKVFGLENWWGNQNRRFSGLVMVNYATKYKITRGAEDGSTATDYNTDGTGYLAGNTAPSSNSHTKKMEFNPNCFLPKEVAGTSSTYWCDGWYQSTGTRYALRGGSSYYPVGHPGAFCDVLSVTYAYTGSHLGASPSCKPTLSKYMTLGYSPVVSFLHDGNYTIKSLKSKIVPVQAGSGDPSPTNIRPISGWSGVNVVVSPTTDAQDGTTYPVSWQTEAGTVYSGIVDIIDGTLMVDKAGVICDGTNVKGTNFIVIGDTSEYIHARGKGRVNLVALSSMPYDATYVCSHMKTYNYAHRRDSVPDCLFCGSSASQIYWISNTFMSLEEFNNYLVNQYNAGTPMTIVYPLKTPLVYHLTPTQVTTLMKNNIWSDTGDTEVTYPLIKK